MSELVAPPRRVVSGGGKNVEAGVAQTLDLLVTVVTLFVVVGVLYFAREILVPVAIAVILSFVLSPPIKLLRRIGLGKKLAVGIVVLVTFLIAAGLAAILAKQVSDLASDAPRYQQTVSRKIARVREFAANNAALAKLNSVIASMDQREASKDGKPGPALLPSAAPTTNKPTPLPVEVVQQPPGALTMLQAAAGAAATPVATAAFVAVFIVFILMQREDLRNRFIRLAGSRDLQRTTLAMNDAARRLSRYFLAQVLLNAGFGAVAAGMLAVIGVPSAMLWGIVAAFLRFIPYVGSIGAALFPFLLALAADSGWAMAIETAALFVVLETIVGQAVEPLVYGRNTGISPVAVIFSATFWTWLWGPVGLVLATPLSVCVVVMGRHVERLAFLDVLLGDAPPLTEVESFYQRMLSGDASEVFDHADRYLAEHSLIRYCDDVAMKALLMAQGDVRRGALDEERQLRIRDTMRDLAEDLADRADAPTNPSDEAEAPASLVTDRGGADDGLRPQDNMPDVELDPEWAREGAVLCVAGRTALDEAAAHLLADLLEAKGVGIAVEPATSLTGDGATLKGRTPRLVILSFLDADLSVAQARFAVRRLRRRLPDASLAAAFWMADQNAERIAALCRDVRADTCVSNLPDAVRLCLERGAGGQRDDASG